jgi:hypothetical protein
MVRRRKLMLRGRNRKSPTGRWDFTDLYTRFGKEAAGKPPSTSPWNEEISP